MIENNTLLAYHGTAQAVTVPMEVTVIADTAFEGCTGITDITLPLACLRLANAASKKQLTAAVFSDTHGSIARLYQVSQALPQIQLLLHLGDFASDGVEMAAALGVPCYAVAGNCDDFPLEGPQERAISFGAVRVLMAHGQRYHNSIIALSQDAAQKGCGVAITGHTHRPILQFYNGCLLMNPGSLNYPRGGTKAGYALLTVDDSCLRVQLITV